MNTKYLIRLEDACHQMPIIKWKKFESFFEIHNIKPIIGVVPENKDKKLGNEYDPDFWLKVKKWDELGWSIALHGLNHLLKPIDQSNSFFSFGKKSEFVGLSKNQQSKIILKSLSIFSSNNIEPKLFMAPSHTFDQITLECLKEFSTIKLITDGFSYRHFKKQGFTFIPQQLWSVKKMPFGLYTICIHPTTMSEHQIEEFLKKLKGIKNQIISLDDLDLSTAQNFDIKDQIFSFIYRIIAKIKFSL